jgi:hypothetical protein
MFPGGVSTLILNTLILLIDKGHISGDLVFLLGSEDKSQWFFDKLKKAIKTGIKVNVEVMPELFYWDDKMGGVAAAAEKIKEKFKRLAGDSRVLWAQNPTLGKSPAYTLALKMLAEENPGQKILMHVHDSAEQGRWPNLDLMVEKLGNSYYFDAPGTRWMVINKTDFRACLEAGMPKERLFYVPDPLLVKSHKPVHGRREIGQTIGRFARKNGFTFDADKPWMLFAGRTIRRKNLLEALLVALCRRDRAAFLITLPSDSPDDKPYEDTLFNAIRKFRAGAAGFGIDCVGTDFSLNDLAVASDLVMSCSVMEGFGLPYLEFPMLGRPLFAKRIYTMDDFSAIREKLPHHYYDSLKVPVEKPVRENQIKRYFKKIDALAGHFRIPGNISDKAKAQIHACYSQDLVDFSYLPASEQAAVVDRADAALLREVEGLNPGVFESLDAGLSDQSRNPAETAAAIDSVFGPDVYARNIERIMKSYDTEIRTDFKPDAFAEKFLGFYFTPENLRLLLDYKPFSK